jgi:hypothetical protein
MKAYIIVRGGNFQELEEKVEELAIEGYDPVGGVSHLANYYVQVVFLKKISVMFAPKDAIGKPDSGNPLDNPPLFLR